MKLGPGLYHKLDEEAESRAQNWYEDTRMVTNVTPSPKL
jgi:hypothetical protein